MSENETDVVVVGAGCAGAATAIRQVTFRVGDDEITRTVKDTAGVDHLIAPRRHILAISLLT